MTDTVLMRLARFIAETPRSAIPAAASQAATESFVDTVGVMILGSAEPVGRITADHARASARTGMARIVAGGAASAMLAAFANASAAHAQDFDDASTTALSGHASAVIVPTVLAVGQECDATGADAIDAYAIGYEVELAMARSVNPYHFDLGFHPTATLGVFGAVAATARLHRTPAAQVVAALAIAASSAAGIKANFGTMTKPLHCGLAARSGIEAVLLAESGISSNSAAFEADQGFGPVYGGPGWRERVGPAFDPLGSRWALVDPGVDLRKLWPACGSLLTTIESALSIRDVGIDIEAIREIRVGLHARRIVHTDRPQPRSGQDARYSAQYVAARALLDGCVTESAFTDQAIASGPVRALMDRTRLAADDRQTARSSGLQGEDLGAVVTVTSTDGQSTTREVDYPKGSPRNPATTAELKLKFAACTEQYLGLAGSLLHAQLSDLATLSSLRALVALGTPQAVAPQR